jgi:N-glycosidase YbiA
MESLALFEEKVILTPRDLSKKGIDLDSLLLEKLQEEREGSCSLHGYVQRGSLRILSRSMGYVEKGRYTGDIVFVVQAEAKVLNAPDGLVLRGEVIRNNKMGMYVNYQDAIRIILPRDLHIGNEEYDSVRIGETVELEVKKSRFQVNDEYILGVGLFLRKASGGAEPVLPPAVPVPVPAPAAKEEPTAPILEGAPEIKLGRTEPLPTAASAAEDVGLGKEEQEQELEEEEEEAPASQRPMGGISTLTPAPPVSLPPAENTIYFYSKLENPYKPFSNFHMASFTVDGKMYPSVEHYFQAMKFPSDPTFQETIRTAKTAAKAKSLGRSRDHPIRENWDSARVDVMKKGLEAKFTQHPNLKALLLSTGSKRLVEASKDDSFWGMGRTGKGKNKLGELLMDLRTQLLRAENN